MNRPRVVEDATDQLALGIASGIYPPGSRLPSVRSLAVQYGINPSTVQVVLARLEAVGFGEAHHGVGFIVRDIRLQGGIDTWRYLFRFSQQLPDLATKMLADILETRRMLVTDAVRAIAADPGSYDPSGVRAAVDQLSLLADRHAELDQLARAEVHAFRMTIAVARRGVALAVLNSVAQMLQEVPLVLEAMYADVELHVQAWLLLLATWEARTPVPPKGIARLEAAMIERDGRVVELFRALMTESKHPEVTGKGR